MDEYIKREALLDSICYETCGIVFCGATNCAFIAKVCSAPVADVTPVVHTRWSTCRFNLETGNYEEQCTRCRNWSKEYSKPYCPNCGAKMDGGKE